MYYVRLIGSVILIILMLALFADLSLWGLSPWEEQLLTPILSVAGIVSLMIILLLLIFLRTALVKESTAMAIMRLGAFNRMVFSKVGHKLDSACEVIADSNYKYKFFGSEFLGRLLGGLRFYIWLLEKIHTYSWDWIKSHPDGTLEPKHEDDEDHIIVQYYAYGLQVKGKGMVTTDKVPIEIIVTLTAWITNPYKALFSVKNWFDTFIARVQPAIRDYINDHSYDFIISDPKKLDEEIMKDLEKRGIIGDLKKTYGVELAKLEFREIKVTDEYQKIITSKLEGEMAAEKRLASTTGALMAMIANQTGATLIAIQNEFRSDPKKSLEKYKGLIMMNKDFIEQQIASDVGALRRFYFRGGKGGMDLIALLGDVFRGAGASNPGNRDEKKRRKNKADDDDDDDDPDEGWEIK